MHEWDYWINPETGKVEQIPIHWAPLAIAGMLYVSVAIGLLMYGGLQ